MPDWLTHSLAGWMTGRAAKLDVSLLVAGALIPDLVKVRLAFQLLHLDTNGFFDPLHTPAGALLVAATVAFLFPRAWQAFALLAAGVGTHFALDMFLRHVSGGMKLLFPVSWQEWQLHLVTSGNYWMTVAAVAAAGLLSLALRWRERPGEA